jgi:hypothetical protein
MKSQFLKPNESIYGKFKELRWNCRYEMERHFDEFGRELTASQVNKKIWFEDSARKGFGIEFDFESSDPDFRDFSKTLGLAISPNGYCALQQEVFFFLLRSRDGKGVYLYRDNGPFFGSISERFEPVYVSGNIPHQKLKEYLAELAPGLPFERVAVKVPDQALSGWND